MMGAEPGLVSPGPSIILRLSSKYWLGWLTAEGHAHPCAPSNVDMHASWKCWFFFCSHNTRRGFANPNQDGKVKYPLIL